MMECKICNSNQTRIIYQGLIRNGGLGNYTKFPVAMWQCENCKMIWHALLFDNEQYYESEEYRNVLEGASDEETFYRLHDKETLDKFRYTGTDIFRGKTVADIGCGAGGYLDFLKGVAGTIIAVEPSLKYRDILNRKGFHTFAYMEDALQDYAEGVDVIVSFDVIEHVEVPADFMRNVYGLLRKGGKAIIGTPTDAPVMRLLLGEVYEKKQLFSTQHPWIFSEQGLEILADEAGFKKRKIRYFQRYGIGNMLGWIKDKTQGSPVRDMFITETLDNVWKGQCSDKKLADYIVLYLGK